jgi:transposase InsO family protein
MLSPFLDQDLKIIRVGGRLDHGKFSEDQKHPMVLPNCHFTKVLMREIHERNLHAGQLATLAIARQKFWPIRGRQIIKQQIRQCIRCFRARPKMVSQPMGSLPSTRITPSPTFHHTGVDYCGPFTIKSSSLRNAKTELAYVAVFVCFATKAVHLELVSRLSTDAFLSAFDRFVSRRGLPSVMHSDRGTNFVGAANKMKDFYKFLQGLPDDDKFRRFFLDNEIQWNFIPPRTPAFGGLWEALVKSFKHHFTRIAGEAHLTFEEFDQLDCKIEAILNSRPLTPLSEDPDDFTALTAGHFLIGRPLVSKPEHDLKSANINRLTRWQRITHMQQHFWHRWSQEYLHQLQVRTKNYQDITPVVEGQLVLLEIENQPPTSWPLGRITAIFPGKDGITRVAKIKTLKSKLRTEKDDTEKNFTFYERPVTKIALLPTETEKNQL